MSSKIITQFVNPPLPVRCNDWRARREDDDEDFLVGWGATEQEAIDDLLELEADRAASALEGK